MGAATGDFVANLDDDDIWFPNHLATLVPLIADGRRTALAYSGSVRCEEQDDHAAPARPREPTSLVYYDRFDRDRLFALDNYIPSNAWVARRDLLQALGEDPYLDLLEDLVLLIRFAEVTDFAFSGEVTTQFFDRTSKADNARFLDRSLWEQAAARVRRMLWKHGSGQPQGALARAG
jgi:hypothetical protein